MNTYAPMDPARDQDAVVRLINLAFASPPDYIVSWISTMGAENVRTLRTPKGVEACLVRIPMGQYFGGRSIPMVGVAGVAVAPEARRRGHALAIMREFISECARDGTPLSALYPSTQALYQRAGYQAAGHHHLFRIATTAIGIRDREGEVVPLGPSDEPAIRDCYARSAALCDGALDRSPYIWSRVRDFRGLPFTGYGIREGDALSGYIFLHQRRNSETMRQELLLSDFVFDIPASGRLLWGFLADFGTVADEVRFWGGALHPALLLLDQQRFKLEFGNYWMLRLTDARAAIESRPFAPELAAQLHLRLDDDLVPANRGDFVLRVRDGAATMEPGGSGRLCLGPRGLAALYAGFASAPALAAAGLAAGDPDVLRAASAVFPMGSPWMTDYF